MESNTAIVYSCCFSDEDSPEGTTGSEFTVKGVYWWNSAQHCWQLPTAPGGQDSLNVKAWKEFRQLVWRFATRLSLRFLVPSADCVFTNPYWKLWTVVKIIDMLQASACKTCYNYCSYRYWAMLASLSFVMWWLLTIAKSQR